MDDLHVCLMFTMNKLAILAETFITVTCLTERENCQRVLIHQECSISSSRYCALELYRISGTRQIDNSPYTAKKHS